MSLKFFLLGLMYFFNLELYSIQQNIFTLMIDPAGDAKHAGRIIEDSFERGITLQCAEKLKKMLEMIVPNLRVILTRFPGESLEPLQNANFANRLEVDLYISIHFYYEYEAKPQLFLFYFMSNPTDGWMRNSSELVFEPYDKAHIHSLSRTKEYAEIMQKALKRLEFSHLFDVKDLFGFPFKPLAGIMCPALALEVSLKTKDQWKTYLEPLMQGLLQVIKNVRKNNSF